MMSSTIADVEQFMRTSYNTLQDDHIHVDHLHDVDEDSDFSSFLELIDQNDIISNPHHPHPGANVLSSSYTTTAPTKANLHDVNRAIDGGAAARRPDALASNILEYSLDQGLVQFDMDISEYNDAPAFPSNKSTFPTSALLSHHHELPYNCKKDGKSLNSFISHAAIESKGTSRSLPSLIRKNNIAAAIHRGRQCDNYKPKPTKNAKKGIMQPPSIHTAHDHPLHDNEDSSAHNCEGKSKRSSKNLSYERERRRKINEKLYALRALVPNISKMDKASIVRDAIDLVQSLQEKTTRIQQEIQALTLWRNRVNKKNFSELATLSHSITHREQKISKVDVSKKKDGVYQLEIICLNGQGLIANLAKALETLGIDMIYASIIAIDDYIVNNMFVQVEKGDLESGELRDMVLRVFLMFGLGLAQ